MPNRCQNTTMLAAALHPLEPLSAEELSAAVAILRADANYQALSVRIRYASVTLHEPAKDLVLTYRSGSQIVREAEIVLLDNADGATHEVLVSISNGTVISWRRVLGAQPPYMFDEIIACERAVKAHPAFRAALEKRGIPNTDLVMIETWCAGNFGRADEQGLRLARALPFLRTSVSDNGYAHPIDGLIAVVDLNRMTMIKLEDHYVVPVPPNDGNYAPESIGALRTDLKPLEISQSEGPSFTVEGHAVHWQKWHFRIGFTPREGLVLHTLGYEDQERIRPILYRASLSEMVVPYGDTSPQHYFKNTLDAGEIGIGASANALRLGCDCLGEIQYFDAVLADNRGDVYTIPNAICMHEEDYGVLWKHVNWRSDTTEVRRSRRLVLSFFCTVGNYDYGFVWYLYQDGTIQFEVKLTGILSTGAVAPGETPTYGVLIAPQLQGIVHQHFFNVRLDFDIDGQDNSVYEVHTEATPPGPSNPYGNAFAPRRTLLSTETEAQQVVDQLAARSWEIVNAAVRNSVGQPVGYRLVPADNVLPFAQPESSVIKRAAFITKHLWVTPYEPSERYAAGEYPNLHAGGEGLPAWTQANRPIANKDIVVWYTFGQHHVPRPEDWPVMPTAHIGFMLKPVGFFDRNPALDVPPPTPRHGACGES